MMSTEAPRSRRDRPAKPALTRESIINAALAILREEGLHKVTKPPTRRGPCQQRGDRHSAGMLPVAFLSTPVGRA